MTLSNYIACFFVGLFIGNFVPHFVKGITGEKFPTPFANPPARGLSSPLTNVLWGLANLAFALICLNWANVATGGYASIITIFVGFALMGIMLSYFITKQQE